MRAVERRGEVEDQRKAGRGIIEELMGIYTIFI